MSVDVNNERDKNNITEKEIKLEQAKMHKKKSAIKNGRMKKNYNGKKLKKTNQKRERY